MTSKPAPTHDATSTSPDDEEDDPGAPTPEQEAEAYAALDELERDQREALREGLRALLDGGPAGLEAAVEGIRHRISDDGADVLRGAARELHPDFAWRGLDDLPYYVDF